MKRQLSAIERLEAVKATLEAFGYSFESLTVSEAFMLEGNIVSAINDSLKECGVRISTGEIAE
jgi:hypothetical protein